MKKDKIKKFTEGIPIWLYPYIVGCIVMLIPMPFYLAGGYQHYGRYTPDWMNVMGMVGSIIAIISFIPMLFDKDSQMYK